MRAVVEKAQSAAARCGVVDYLGHERAVFAEVELVADTYLAGRLDEHVPELVVGVELAQEEYLDAGAGLLLVAVEQGRKYLSVIEYHHVALVVISQDILEGLVLDFAGTAVYHHQAALVALGSRVLRNQFVG